MFILNMQGGLPDGAVVVTGAGSGIGEGVARRAAALGHPVVLADISAPRLDAVATELRAAGHVVVTVVVDVSDADAVERLAELAFERCERVGVVLNNAGIEATGYSWEMSAATVERLIRVNLLGVFNGVRAFVPRLLEQGGRSAVVNLASLAALLSGPLQQAPYNASKHGVLALTETLHLELTEIEAPISVHAVTPGPVATRIFDDSPGEGSEAESYRASYGEMVTERGLSGLEAGELILAGVGRGAFWIETHPDWQEAAVRRRSEMLLRRQPPAPTLLAES